jgi:hypothetical protein
MKYEIIIPTATVPLEQTRNSAPDFLREALGDEGGHDGADGADVDAADYAPCVDDECEVLRGRGRGGCEGGAE